MNRKFPAIKLVFVTGEAFQRIRQDQAVRGSVTRHPFR